MTTSEIKYIIQTTLGEPLDMITPLKSVTYIKLSSHETKFVRQNAVRFKFNTSTKMLECYECKEYIGNIPDEWIEGKHYDTFGDKVYKYMFNEKTLEPYVDVYDFNIITCIAPYFGGDK